MIIKDARFIRLLIPHSQDDGLDYSDINFHWSKPRGFSNNLEIVCVDAYFPCLILQDFFQNYTKQDADKLIDKFTEEIREFAMECLYDAEYEGVHCVDFMVGVDKLCSAIRLAFVECRLPSIKKFEMEVIV